MQLIRNVRESAQTRIGTSRRRALQGGAISTGTGAELLGVPLYDFIQLLGQHQVSVFNYAEKELQQDVQAAKAARDEAREQTE